MFKLFLCNPFARSAGIFLTCLRAFTRFYALLRAFISVKQFNVFTRFYALLRAFTRFYALLSQLSSLQFTPFTVYSVNNLNASSIKLAVLLAFTGS